MSIEREQALAFRVAGQNLHERTDPLTAVAACGLQEAPPGWLPVALHARAEGSLDPDQVVLVNAMRGSPWCPCATCACSPRRWSPTTPG